MKGGLAGLRLSRFRGFSGAGLSGMGMPLRMKARIQRLENITRSVRICWAVSMSSRLGLSLTDTLTAKMLMKRPMMMVTAVMAADAVPSRLLILGLRARGYCSTCWVVGGWRWIICWRWARAWEPWPELAFLAGLGWLCAVGQAIPPLPVLPAFLPLRPRPRGIATMMMVMPGRRCVRCGKLIPDGRLCRGCRVRVG